MSKLAILSGEVHDSEENTKVSLPENLTFYPLKLAYFLLAILKSNGSSGKNTLPGREASVVSCHCYKTKGCWDSARVLLVSFIILPFSFFVLVFSDRQGNFSHTNSLFQNVLTNSL